MYDVPRLDDQVVLVTGANSGTGKECARRLAGAGATVVMAVRSLDKGAVARDDILEQHPRARLDVRELDLASQASVRAFSSAFTADYDRLHVLFNNAGVMAPAKRLVTDDGFELQMATNFLGPFALTGRLLATLLATPAARVATMSSTVATYGVIRFSDLTWRRFYRPYVAYAQSKLADLLFASHLATLAHEQGWDLMSTAAHPGFTRTNLQFAGASLGQAMEKHSFINNLVFLPSQLPEQGAEPLLYAGTSADAISGAYYGPDGLFHLVGSTTFERVPRSARSATKAARLFALAEQLTGVTFAA